MTYQPLEFTGERMVPEDTGREIFWEHIYRYKLAVPYVKGKRVLDIACGEGYGSAALVKAEAASVIGVDISPETCKHAMERYGIDARVGDAQNIPLPDQSVDVIVSFETIEHVEKPEAFLKECARLLTPEGVLIISTPNKSAYTYKTETDSNPYHCSELSEQEFTSLLAEHWSHARLYTQKLKSIPWWSPRALALEDPPWTHIRGLGRLSRTIAALRRKICPYVTQVDVQYQRDPIAAVFIKDTPLAGVFNPYIARERVPQRAGTPVYLIAIASNH